MYNNTYNDRRMVLTYLNMIILSYSFLFPSAYGFTEVVNSMEEGQIGAQNNINSNRSTYEKNNTSIMKNSSIESNSEELRYKKGQTFSISIKSFATMGYRWNITNDYNTTVIRYIDHSFKVADPKVIGGPTSEVFNFEALNTGSTTLKFSNVRGLHEGPEQEKIYSIKVTE
jgi:predicted secreted protein